MIGAITISGNNSTAQLYSCTLKDNIVNACKGADSTVYVSDGATVVVKDLICEGNRLDFSSCGLEGSPLGIGATCIKVDGIGSSVTAMYAVIAYNDIPAISASNGGKFEALDGTIIMNSLEVKGMSSVSKSKFSSANFELYYSEKNKNGLSKSDKTRFNEERRQPSRKTVGKDIGNIQCSGNGAIYVSNDSFVYGAPNNTYNIYCGGCSVCNTCGSCSVCGKCTDSGCDQLYGTKV